MLMLCSRICRKCMLNFRARCLPHSVSKRINFAFEAHNCTVNKITHSISEAFTNWADCVTHKLSCMLVHGHVLRLIITINSLVCTGDNEVRKLVTVFCRS